MTTTYKVGKGRGTRSVQARQYTRDQDWELANWIKGPVQVYRDHFRVGADETRATKGDWILQPLEGEPGTVQVLDGKTFGLTAREVKEENNG